MDKRVMVVIIGADKATSIQVERCKDSVINQTMSDVGYCYEVDDCCDAEYIYFISACDWLYSDAVSNLFSLAKLYDADFIKSGTIYLDTDFIKLKDKEDFYGIRKDIFEYPINIKNNLPWLSRIDKSFRGIFIKTSFLKSKNILFSSSDCKSSILLSIKCLSNAKTVILTKIKTVYHVIDDISEQKI